MRKIATLLAAATATAMLAAGSSAVSPSSAQAAACKWRMPTSTNIHQRNGYIVNLTYNRRKGAWQALYGTPDLRYTKSAEVEFTSVTPRLVKFIITWYDVPSGIYKATGIYTGTIDPDGFVTGTTRDRFNSSSRASWYMSARARCV